MSRKPAKSKPSVASRKTSAGVRAAGRSATIRWSKLKLHSVHDRQHISQVESFAGLPEPQASFSEWFAALPDFLGAKRLRAVVGALVAARRAGKPVVAAMGGHVVKVGCGPVLIDLLERGILTGIACHGATAIHDVEVAMLGATSEDVSDTIRDGRFGMVRETMDFFCKAVKQAQRKKLGLGRAIGELVLASRFPQTRYSVLAAAARLDRPATVHVAIGTDTVHMSPKMDGAALGAATLADFRALCGIVAQMGDNGEGYCGVWCNIGSAVLMPEVFLKALAVARNLGANLDQLTTVNIDMLRHYRPTQNVVGRPVAAGRGHDLAGHHEIILPLLRQAIIEQLPKA